MVHAALGMERFPGDEGQIPKTGIWVYQITHRHTVDAIIRSASFVSNFGIGKNCSAFVVVRELIQTKGGHGSQAYRGDWVLFGVFVTNRAGQLWKCGATTMVGLPWSAGLTNSRTNWRPITSVSDRFSPYELAVLFRFDLLIGFQRAVGPTVKNYQQPATLRFEVFTSVGILGRNLIIWCRTGGYSQRKPLFNSLLHWPPPIFPKFDSPTESAT